MPPQKEFATVADFIICPQLLDQILSRYSSQLNRFNMKNPKVETLRLAAKRHHRNHHAGHFTNGVRTYHRYDHRSADDLSWWDDCAFVLNDYLVHLSWVHPRMVFKDKIEEEAFKRVEHLDFNYLDFDGTPVYKLAGKSRKKIVSRKIEPSINNTWRDSFKQAFAELIHTEEVSIVPFIKAHWTNHSRFVELCAPVEVRNENDLVIIANLAKRLLKGETTWDEQFPGYRYRAPDWEQDVLVNEESAHGFAVHRLA